MARRRTNTKSSRSTLNHQDAQSDDHRYIVVLFADIVGCSEISNNECLSVYNNFLKEYKECFDRICNYYKKYEYESEKRKYFDSKVRGDEGCLMIFMSGNDASLSKDIDVAIRIALDLKRNWLFTEYNTTRIKNCLLPVDLGIGIHSGKVFLNRKDNRPEGYAINLAKKVESASRDGKFTRILVSESARGQLYKLTDEPTYKFATPFRIDPKGITRDIKVFEINHHFLPTDWYDLPLRNPAIYPNINNDKVDILKQANSINPMNLWLAEEYIIVSMVNSYLKLIKEDKESDTKARKSEYSEALRIAQSANNTDLRDAGLLSIQGLISGEMEDYQKEQSIYREGIKLEKQYGEIYWYLAYSLSVELSEAYKKRKKGMTKEEFYEIHKPTVNEILEHYRTAIERRPVSAWIIFDYACELSWWCKVEEKWRKEAIVNLIKAFKYLNDTTKRAKKEPYLKPIIDDPEVKKYL